MLVNRDPANGAPSNVDRTFTNEGRALMSGVDLQVDWNRDLWGGNFGLNSVANFNLHSITQERPSVVEVERAGYNSCSLQIQCQRHDYRVFSTFSYFRGAWNASLRHQYWPELTDESCKINPAADSCRFSSYPDQHMFAATFGYRFGDKYQVERGHREPAGRGSAVRWRRAQPPTVRVHLRACVASAGRSVQRHLRRARTPLLRRYDDGLLIRCGTRDSAAGFVPPPAISRAAGSSGPESWSATRTRPACLHLRPAAPSRRRRFGKR